MSGNIDWSQLVTKAMKEQTAAAEVLASVVADTAARRAVAAEAIIPLQYAVDVDEASDEDLALLKLWKKYVVALSKLPQLPGYPTAISWPVAPA